MRLNFSLVPPQRNRAELLDLNKGSRAEIRRSLHDIRRINKFLGGTKISTDAVFSLLETPIQGKSNPRNASVGSASVLDVGTGIADIPLHLQREGARRGWELQVFGMDINARHLEIAQQELPDASRVLLMCGDAFRLPLADGSIDIVHSSLFLHHFRPREIQVLLREFSRVARVGWVMNDLERHGLPAWFFRTSWPVFARSYITRLDGISSIRRAYTKAEMQRVVRGIPNVEVERKLPFRLCAWWRRR